MEGEPLLPPEIAVKIAHAISNIEAVLIGGQAVNFWAEFYSAEVPQLAQFGPYASKDIDFYGFKNAAAELAAKLGGRVFVPTLDDHNTPNTALIKAVIDGHTVTIDFLNSVLGIHRRRFRAVLFGMIVDVAGQQQQFRIKIMHPVDCLISRVTNILHPAIMRSDQFAIRQLYAAHWILRHYVRKAIEANDDSEVNLCLRDLHHFLLKDEYGQCSHVASQIDHLDILKNFSRDEKIDLRYRERLLAKMISRIEEKRGVRPRIQRRDVGESRLRMLQPALTFTDPSVPPARPNR